MSLASRAYFLIVPYRSESFRLSFRYRSIGATIGANLIFIGAIGAIIDANFEFIGAISAIIGANIEFIGDILGDIYRSTSLNW